MDRYNVNLYQRTRRAKHRVQAIKEEHRKKRDLLPNNAELRKALKNYYKKKIEEAEEKYSRLLMEYYSL